MSNQEEEDLLIALGKRVAEQFTVDPKFVFLGFAGFGRHGGTLILSEQNPPGEEVRKVVIKYSYGVLSPDTQENADEQLRNEYKWLKRLRGAEHIVQLINLEDRPIRIPGASTGEDSQPEVAGDLKPDDEAAYEERARKCPSFALEFLGGGTIYAFRKKLRAKGYRYLPSRLLWRIWLCMMRQCAAMAFPPDIPDGDPREGTIERETLKDGPYLRLTQNSPHGENFMFDLAKLPGTEHGPDQALLKLIDFGRGTIEPMADATRFLHAGYDRYGSRLNVRHAACGFMHLCALSSRANYDLLEIPVPYSWTSTAGIHTILTSAPGALRTNTIIDRELRHMLVRALGDRLGEALSLQYIINRAEQILSEAPRPPTEDALAVGIQETEAEVDKILQDTLFDAN